MENYLALGPLLVSRLKEKLAYVSISLHWVMPHIKEAHDLPPSILVFLEDDQPAQEVSRGAQQKVIQTWIALVIIHDTDEAAGELISRVFQALAGWSPDDTRFFPFRRVKSSYKPDVSPNGVSYFPLSFESSFIFDTQS